MQFADYIFPAFD
jgi:2-oxoisovalerate dehydrogenase E1 component beta subunit